MGKNYYAECRRMYSAADSPAQHIEVLNDHESDDELLEEGLFQAAKHMANYAPLMLWLAREHLPNQKNAAGMMKVLVSMDPMAGQARTELFMEVIRWCKAVSFQIAYPRIWQKVEGQLQTALDKNFCIMKAQGVHPQQWWISCCQLQLGSTASMRTRCGRTCRST